MSERSESNESSCYPFEVGERVVVAANRLYKGGKVFAEVIGIKPEIRAVSVTSDGMAGSHLVAWKDCKKDNKEIGPDA